MLKVNVPSGEAKVITWGANELGRKPGSMRVQEVWLHTVDEKGKPAYAPTRIELILNGARIKQDTGEVIAPEQPAYAAGDYELHPSSIYVGRDGRPGLSIRLAPLKRPA